MSNVNIKAHIDVDAILAKRGLGSSHEAQKKMASQFARACDKYVPYLEGAAPHMKTAPDIASDGSTITYRGPYAHFQYVGEVMIGASGSPWAKSGEQKHYAGRPLTYSGEATRGANWDKRYMADHGKEFTEDCAKFVGGKAT
jgi:hypothetical protein